MSHKAYTRALSAKETEGTSHTTGVDGWWVATVWPTMKNGISIVESMDGTWALVGCPASKALEERLIAEALDGRV